MVLDSPQHTADGGQSKSYEAETVPSRRGAGSSVANARGRAEKTVSRISDLPLTGSLTLDRSLPPCTSISSPTKRTINSTAVPYNEESHIAKITVK